MATAEQPGYDENLDDFEGESVEAIGIEIPAAAGGLQDALAFDPIAIHRGDVLYCVLRLRCDKVRFEPFKDSGNLRRVSIMTPIDDLGEKGGGMFVPADFVEQQLREYNEQLRIRKEQAAGVFRLDANAGGGGEDGDENPGDGTE